MKVVFTATCGLQFEKRETDFLIFFGTFVDTGWSNIEELSLVV